MKITIIEGGPALIESDDYLLIQNKAGIFPGGETGGVVKKAAICRCGLSADKTWCDGSHRHKNTDNEQPKEASAI